MPLNPLSIDLIGKFAIFKKNDTNEMVHCSYNFIHKPAILGIIGAILGYSGYSKSEYGGNPEYYEKLKDIKIAIAPHYLRPLKKMIVGFNDSSGMSSDVGTWQVKEQILVGKENDNNREIKYTIYFMGNNVDARIIEKIRYSLSNKITEFPIYFGKNEFFAHYENYQEYEAKKIEGGESDPVRIQSLIKKGKDDEVIRFQDYSLDEFDPFQIDTSDGYTIYENLPYDFCEDGFYKKEIFVLTENKVIIESPKNFYTLKPKNDDEGEVNVHFI